jgi:hypothetical protein
MVNCRSILIRKYIEFGLNLNMGILILKSVGSDERSKVLKSIRFNEVKAQMFSYSLSHFLVLFSFSCLSNIEEIIFYSLVVY